MITEDIVMEVFSQAFVVAIKVAAPILAISLIVGLVIAVMQAATQIHEQTLTFVPKLIAIGVVLIIAAPWMFGVMKDFSMYIFETIAFLA